ncbi:MFS transporter [Celeribacter naphthalenivorans]|uniref:MFS transporter n=1 Tax=Celeribacter naphthalenivorans TaxID=1614694 RepID=UPI001CFC24C1|nr:MFS transporter [Celeribacter naphthalenivorans]
MAETSSSLRLFKHRPFLVYWLAGFSANFGWQIQLVGASWLMTSLGGTPELVAMVQTVVALPVMLLSLPGGALSDLIGQRTLTLWAQSFLLVVSALLALGAFFGLLTPTLLLICTFLIGSGRALYYPGWQATVFEFVPKSEVTAAVALNSSNLNIARSLGPAIGGVIVAAAGAFVAFVVNALSNLSVIFVASRWPKARPSQDLPPEPLGRAIMAGLRYVTLSPVLIKLGLRSVVFNISAIAVLAMLPLIARDQLDSGAGTFGVLLAAFGVGAVAGSLYIDRLRRLIPLEKFLAFGFLCFASGTAILGVSTWTALSIFGALIAGAAWSFVQVTLYSIVQISSPRWVLSRTIAIYQIFVFGGNAIGSLIWGDLAGNSGTEFTMLVAAGIMAAGALLGTVFRINEVDGSRVDISGSWVAPKPALDMAMKSGPVLTTITYRIREIDAPVFVDAMREKRRNRIRDGAMRWTLSRDILDPELWYERFKVATWADAQRLHARRTTESTELIEFIRGLHQGDQAPEVHYELVRDPGVSLNIRDATVTSNVP